MCSLAPKGREFEAEQYVDLPVGREVSFFNIQVNPGRIIIKIIIKVLPPVGMLKVV